MIFCIHCKLDLVSRQIVRRIWGEIQAPNLYRVAARGASSVNRAGESFSEGALRDGVRINRFSLSLPAPSAINPGKHGHERDTAVSTGVVVLQGKPRSRPSGGDGPRAPMRFLKLGLPPWGKAGSRHPLLGPPLHPGCCVSSIHRALASSGKFSDRYVLCPVPPRFALFQ